MLPGSAEILARDITTGASPVRLAWHIRTRAFSRPRDHPPDA